MLIKDLPAVIRKMVEKRKDDEDDEDDDTVSNAFLWAVQPEGDDFWHKINRGDYSLFYKKYPTKIPKDAVKIVFKKDVGSTYKKGEESWTLKNDIPESIKKGKYYILLPENNKRYINVRWNDVEFPNNDGIKEEKNTEREIVIEGGRQSGKTSSQILFRDHPKEIIDRCLEICKKQGRDVQLNESLLHNFDWSHEGGTGFWSKVNRGDYSEFYKRYPKETISGTNNIFRNSAKSWRDIHDEQRIKHRKLQETYSKPVIPEKAFRRMPLLAHSHSIFFETPTKDIAFQETKNIKSKKKSKFKIITD